jgi:hypothetical protein
MGYKTSMRYRYTQIEILFQVYAVAVGGIPRRWDRLTALT